MADGHADGTDGLNPQPTAVGDRQAHPPRHLIGREPARGQQCRLGYRVNFIYGPRGSCAHIADDGLAIIGGSQRNALDNHLKGISALLVVRQHLPKAVPIDFFDFELAQVADR
ncbi:MAG: hypothetical protein Q7T86_19475 [Hyphomicrobiaceae bacterium]|nr:hypothetical protein [Hyphomicrobiaceae bacterium]